MGETLSGDAVDQELVRAREEMLSFFGFFRLGFQHPDWLVHVLPGQPGDVEDQAEWGGDPPTVLVNRTLTRRKVSFSLPKLLQII